MEGWAGVPGDLRRTPPMISGGWGRATGARRVQSEGGWTGPGCSAWRRGSRWCSRWRWPAAAASTTAPTWGRTAAPTPASATPMVASARVEDGRGRLVPAVSTYTLGRMGHALPAGAVRCRGHLHPGAGGAGAAGRGLLRAAERRLPAGVDAGRRGLRRVRRGLPWAADRRLARARRSRGGGADGRRAGARRRHPPTPSASAATRSAA